MSSVVLDSNIWISAFQFGGNPHTIVQLVLDGELEVAVSAHIIEETTRILQSKFGWQPDDLARVRDIMELHTQMVVPTQRLTAVPADPDDNRIVECAIAAEANVIVTGDKDLLRLGCYAGILIMTVSDFLRGLAH